MRLKRATLAPLLFASLTLCLGARAEAREGQGVPAEARQLALAADDYAATLAGRREALRLLEEAARLHSEAGREAEAARALNRAGRLRLLLSEPKAALEAHRRALFLLGREPDAEAEADALGGLGETHLHLNKLEQAERSLRRALAVSERGGYERVRARALVTLSVVQIYKDQTLAMATAEEALALWQSLGDPRELARAYSQVGRCLFTQNRFVESARNYERAAQLSRELGDRSGEAGALIMLGLVKYRKDEWRANVALLTQAQALIDEEAEPEMMGQIAAGLAELFNEAGLPEVGLAHYGRAVEYFRRTHDPHLVWYAIWGLGCTHFLLGDYPAAFRELRRSLEGMKKDRLEKDGLEKDGFEAAQTYHYLGRTHLATGDTAAALRYFRSALDIYEHRNNSDWAARARGLMGQAYERAGHVEAARESYLKALETFGRLSNRVNEAAVAYALGRLELTAGNLDAAEKYLSLSIEATEGVRRDSTSSDLTAAFSATFHERYEAYVELLMRRHAADPARGFDVLAFENSESARARSLTELLHATEASLVPGLDPRLAERERSLRHALRAREDDRMVLLRGQYERPALEALDADLARLRAEYASVEDAIRALHPSYGQIARPSGWNLERIRRQVVDDDETVLLEYGLGAERGYVWAVTREGLRSYELPPRALVERTAGRFYGLLSRAWRERGIEREVEEAARELSRMVLAPAAASLRGKSRVIVVADGGLNYIPFQALSAPANGEPLVADYEVVNAPSASVLGQLREEAGRRLPPAKTLVAFGDPVFESNYALRKSAAAGNIELTELRKTEEARFRNSQRDIEVAGDLPLDPSTAEPLTYAGMELRNLREVAADSLVAADFDATRERLQQTDLSEFAIVHFATHGLLDPRRPERSGLLLSTVDREGCTHGGFVGLRDVYSLRAPVGLVVLSACRTALGKEVRGEGMIGLTRGFLYAGASSVVSSLWKVDDEATSELMRRFYENMLRDGMTPAAALRAAQNSIRREPHWRSPFYWAAFTLQGEYRQVLRPARASGLKAYTKTLASGGLVLSLAALAAWWLRRRRASALS